jgi:hypothetical protein
MQKQLHKYQITYKGATVIKVSSFYFYAVHFICGITDLKNIHG